MRQTISSRTSNNPYDSVSTLGKPVLIYCPKIQSHSLFFFYSKVQQKWTSKILQTRISWNTEEAFKSQVLLTMWVFIWLKRVCYYHISLSGFFMLQITQRTLTLTQAVTFSLAKVTLLWHTLITKLCEQIYDSATRWKKIVEIMNSYCLLSLEACSIFWL